MLNFILLPVMHKINIFPVAITTFVVYFTSLLNEILDLIPLYRDDIF